MKLLDLTGFGRKLLLSELNTKKESGNAMIMALTVSALVLAIAAGMSRMQIHQKAIEKNEMQSLKIDHLRGELQRLLVSPENCRLNFLGKKAYSHDINGFRRRAQDGTILTERKFSLGAKLSKTLVLRNSYLQDATGDDVQVVAGGQGTTNLVLEFERLLGAQHRVRSTERIRLNVTTSGAGHILECSSANTGEDILWNRSPSNPANIFSNSGVGIGTGDDELQAALEIRGQIRVGAGNPTCDAFRAGSIRYQAGVLQFCDGEKWTIGAAGTKHAECKWKGKPWDDWVNKYDKQFDYQCPEGTMIVGVISKHNSKHEDRKFNFLCCELR